MIFKKIIILLISLALLNPLSVFALMTSTNYTIFADDFNSGIVATSSAYRMESTVGESPADLTTSTSYTISGGYQAMDRVSLSLSISDSSLDLGNLSTSQVSSDNTTVTVTTESDTGYNLGMSAESWSGTALADVSDNTVTAGAEEYGFSITGLDVNNSLLSIDNDIGNLVLAGTTVMSSSTSVTNSTSTLTFKASIGSGTGTGSRAHTVTLTLSAGL
jgi:hypothetical protein